MSKRQSVFFVVSGSMAMLGVLIPLLVLLAWGQLPAAPNGVVDEPPAAARPAPLPAAGMQSVAATPVGGPASALAAPAASPAASALPPPTPRQPAAGVAGGAPGGQEGHADVLPADEAAKVISGAVGVYRAFRTGWLAGLAALVGFLSWLCLRTRLGLALLGWLPKRSRIMVPVCLALASAVINGALLGVPAEQAGVDALLTAALAVFGHRLLARSILGLRSPERQEIEAALAVLSRPRPSQQPDPD